MYAPVYKVGVFERFERDEQIAILVALLEALAVADIVQLRRDPTIPPLYTSGVRYIKEPPGQDDWLDISEVRRLGGGDCEDLVAWRVAELRFSGERARFDVERFIVDNGIVFHIRVKRGNGAIEDPSKLLGMTGEA